MPPKPNHPDRPLRVLHSFPHRLGMSRICMTAWQEVDSTARAGAELHVMAGDSVRPFTTPVHVQRTLAWGRLRLPYRGLGARRMCALHDAIVAHRLPSLAGRVDIIHAWPLGALRTMRAARRLGIPVALERCNAHTRFAYDVVRRECERIGVPLPCGHEHAYDAAILHREEQEYAAADGILCPSDFVVKTFVDQGFPRDRLFRFIYGVDESVYHPPAEPRDPARPFTLIYVGVAAVRKGLHLALDAWLQSRACHAGRFLIVGGFIPEYRAKLAPLLAHPSVEVLGHRDDVPALMRASDAFVLPSIEEGFGLVCTEAMASGCVPLVSDACTDVCRHDDNALVHAVGDVTALREHMDALFLDRERLARLRANGLNSIPTLTWSAAGHSLVAAYRNIMHSAASGWRQAPVEDKGQSGCAGRSPPDLQRRARQSRSEDYP